MVMGEGEFKWSHFVGVSCTINEGAGSLAHAFTSSYPNLITVFIPNSAKKKKMADKILPQRVSAGCRGLEGAVTLRMEAVSSRAQSYLSVPKIRELVPESQAYMDLLAFERKLDQTIMRKRLDIQEALKRPIKVTQDSTGKHWAEGQGRGP